MVTINTLDYLADYYELEPSLFRESDNLHKLFQSIFSVYHEQQIDLLWFSENILNIDTAESFHLDFIGKLVGQDRFLVGFNAETYFGFEGAYKSDTFGSSLDPEVGGYWNSRSYFNAATARRLSDDEYRRIIKARIISNHSNCSPNDLLEVINLITNRTDNTTQTIQHGIITVKSKDNTGLLSYFVDSIDTKANILPIAAGVRVGLEQSASAPVDMGLAKDYSGSGWYKATDTGTVFNKGVPALETHVFSDSPKEYVSVYTKEDARLYGEGAATSNLTDMSSLFYKSTSFNQDISSWDTSSVTDMNRMFVDAASFNQDISMWDVSNVVDMSYMFNNATSFNQDLSSWNTGSVINMYAMFSNARSFNSDISNWDVGKVTNMSNMFSNAKAFSSDLSNWDVSSVTNMFGMFYNVTLFNSDISNWDVGKVTNMGAMFNSATSFNRDLSGWCVTNIPKKPSNFDLSATAWTLPKPVWGTCPRGEAG